MAISFYMYAHYSWFAPGCRCVNQFDLVDVRFDHLFVPMSITLEGNATAAEEEGTWSGLWRFTKEKKSFLAYTFKV